MVELEGRKPIINTGPHHWQYSKENCAKEWLRLEEWRERVRRYVTTRP